MFDKFILLIITVLFTFLLSMCKHTSNTGNDANISSDVVQNPVTAGDTTNSGNLPVFSFTEESHDFGMVVQGEKVTHTFKFKNTGRSSLIIASASGSCGCTVPKYQDKPVLPGKEGEIEVVFNTEGRHGMQNKTVTILANTQPNRKVLTISANIIVPN